MTSSWGAELPGSWGPGQTCGVAGISRDGLCGVALGTSAVARRALPQAPGHPAALEGLRRSELSAREPLDLD